MDETTTHEENRDNTKVFKKDVLAAIKKVFEEKFSNLTKRNKDELDVLSECIIPKEKQDISGNFLTVFEMELKDEIKKIKDVE